MADSIRPRKLAPGFTAQYSKPSDLITSIMKSEPGRTGGNDAGPAEESTTGLAAAGASATWVWALALPANNAPTPPAATFRKSLRSWGLFSGVFMFTSHFPFGVAGYRAGAWNLIRPSVMVTRI